MGINFRIGEERCKAQWSYSGFHSFRKNVAKDLGIDLEEMQGFCTWDKSASLFDQTPRSVGTRKWSTVKDPLAFLLKHSDCDGSLSPKQCEKIAPRLREVCLAWDDKWLPDVANHDKVNGLLLADAMTRAAKLKKRLLFT